MIHWKKCPSVTMGGKGYFYTANTPIGRYWIAWDRFLKSYTITSENNSEVTKVKNIQEGMLKVAIELKGGNR